MRAVGWCGLAGTAPWGAAPAVRPVATTGPTGRVGQRAEVRKPDPRLRTGDQHLQLTEAHEPSAWGCKRVQQLWALCAPRGALTRVRRGPHDGRDSGSPRGGLQVPREPPGPFATRAFCMCLTKEDEKKVAKSAEGKSDPGLVS